MPRAAPTRPTAVGSGHIFVAIASYCDPELPRTLDDCIHTAKHPDKLRFGICWQYDRQQPVDVEKFKADPRFQFVEYAIEDSQGGTWARSIAQKFWNGEQYTLQVDSHMKFEPGWDVKLIRQMEKLPSKKPLITVCSPVFWFTQNGKDGQDGQDGKIYKATDKGVPTSKLTSWLENWGWTMWVDYGKVNTQRPGRTRFITGNFVFTLGEWNVEVPQDPAHYYWGEEFNLTIRSYTHGYDLFLPDEIVVWHMDHRDKRPRRHWEKGQAVIDQKNAVAFERLRMLLYSDDPAEMQQLGQFGLGSERGKREYEMYAGIDFANKRAHPDVYQGNNPNPVTILSEQDWEQCVTYADYQAAQCSLELITAYPNQHSQQSKPKTKEPPLQEPFLIQSMLSGQEHALGDTITPLRVPNVTVSERGQETRVAPPQSTMAFSLQQASRAVWQLCDGQHTVTDIMREVQQTEEGRSLSQPAEVSTLLLRLAELGVIRLPETQSGGLDKTKRIDLRDLTFYIINLKDDTKRRAFIEEQLETRKLRYQFVTGVRATPPALGIALSHLKILGMPGPSPVCHPRR